MTHVSHIGSTQFQTCQQVCQKMESLLDWNDFTILEPTPGAGNLSSFLFKKGYRVIVPENEFWEDYEKLKSTEIDAVVMNPPFSPMVDAWKFIKASMELSNHIVAIVPWVLLVNSHKRIDELSTFGWRGVWHLPRKAFPGSRVQTCIIDLDKNWPEPPRLQNFIW